jgi:hypothetical protein
MKKLNDLYEQAFGSLREKARLLGITLKQLAQSQEYSGKVLRRGTPGAFGFDLRPRKSAKTDRAGYPCGGNSRQRRFARRHQSHFVKVS